MGLIWTSPNSQNLDEDEFPYIAIAAYDTDGDNESSVNYQIVGGLDAALFEITSEGLVFKTGILADWEGYESSLPQVAHQYNVLVRATHDYYTGSLEFVHVESDRSFTLVIGDKGSRVETGLQPDPLHISESIGPGQVVYSWEGSSIGDGRGESTVTLSDDAGGAFYLDTRTDEFGTFYELKILDESKFDFEGGAPLQFTVDIDDGTTVVQQTWDIAIDNFAPSDPVDADGEEGGTVAENSLAGTVIGITAQANDIHGGDVTYAFYDFRWESLFAIDETTGVVTVSNDHAIDYEFAQSGYDLIIKAIDSTGASSFSTFHVAVTDANDRPEFNYYDDTVYFAEDGGVLVGTFTANDQDGDTLEYMIAGIDSAFFTYDAATGELRFRAPPDYENPLDDDGDGVYDLILAANDGTVATSIDLHVEVTDVAHTPVIAGDENVSLSFTERQARGTLIADVDATDADGDAITYSLGGYDSLWFDIDSDTGEVTFSTTLDHDDPFDWDGDNIYDFYVVASDGHDGAIQNYSLEITEQANRAPVFASGYTGTRVVNEGYDSVFVLASDPDNDDLSFSLSGTDAGKFNLTSAGGTARLQFKQTSDFEKPADSNKNNVYDVKLTVSDGHGGSVTKDVNIHVADVNEPVAITSNGGGGSASVTVKENIRAVTKVVASDPDAGSHITYSLVSGSASPDKAKFVIDSRTGQMSFVSPPDYETKADANRDNKYVVQVKATSGSSSDIQTLTVSVANDDGKAKTGTKKAETLTGTSSEEKLTAKQGNDTIKALAGADTLNGGTGADKLYGGADEARDIFVFLKGDSGKTSKTWDQVFDFKSGTDKIDLSGIDGDPAKGHQDLRFVSKFEKPGSKTDGQFRVVDDGKHVNIEIDYNGDKKADMIIHVLNVDKLAAADFIV